jgi:hypothetical protein
MIRKTVWIDDNGQVINEDQETLTSPMTDEGYRIPSHKSGARIFSDVLYPAELTDSELGKMTRLAKCMVGRTNMLGYRRNKTIKAYTSEEIGEIVGLHGAKGRKFMARMQRLHMIQRVSTESGPQYYINPMYFMANGQRLSLDLFLLFRDWIEGILPRWAINDFLRQAQDKAVPASTTEAERIVRGQ